MLQSGRFLGDYSVADVFLSYKREDRERARAIAEAITGHGYSVFYDAAIDVGESWNRRIAQEIADARCVAVLWSAASTNVDKGEWVHNEARNGKERRILAPALINACAIPLEFSSVQAANLSDWRGDLGDPEWQHFVKRIANCLSQPPVNLPPAGKKRASKVWLFLTAAVVVLAAGAGAAWYMGVGRAPADLPKGPATPNPTAIAVARVPSEMAIAALGPEWTGYVTQANCLMMQRWIDDVGKQYPDWDVVIAGRGQTDRMCGGAVKDEPSPPIEPPPVLSSPTKDFLGLLRAQDPAPLTDAQLADSAARLGVESEAIKAILHFQGGRGTGFTPDGLPVINFESQVFSRLTDGAYDASHPNVSTAAFKGDNYSRPQKQRWEQLTEAYALNPEAALSATAWGRFRILGSNYKAGGFDSQEAFVRSQATSEDAQLRAFEHFLTTRKLVASLAARDWRGFARGFFGTEQFGAQLEKYYQAFKNGQTP